MAGRFRERHSRKREQHCKGPEALRGLGRFQNRWNPLMSQPTAIHVAHVEVRVTFSQESHAIDLLSICPQPLSAPSVLEALSSLGLCDTNL